VKYLAHLFERNQAWAGERVAADPGYFSRLAHIQRPDLLWIGCSDSRVPANQIVGLEPGELFVHRNVANVVPVTDLNAMAVIEYAVSSLGVRHIIVCGHYRCGGVRAALEGHQAGAVALWLQPLRNLAAAYREELHEQPTSEVVQAAWERGAELAVHGWIYDLEDGLLRDLEVTRGRVADAGG
jgi:carbonic anhydrase